MLRKVARKELPHFCQWVGSSVDGIGKKRGIRFLMAFLMTLEEVADGNGGVAAGPG